MDTWVCKTLPSCSSDPPASSEVIFLSPSVIAMGLVIVLASKVSEHAARCTLPEIKVSQAGPSEIEVALEDSDGSGD
eukprot:3334759-Amphidinium_carterae.1